MPPFLLPAVLYGMRVVKGRDYCSDGEGLPRESQGLTVAARQPRQPCSKVQTVSIRSSKMGCDPLDLEGGKGSWPKLGEGQREIQEAERRGTHCQLVWGLA